MPHTPRLTHLTATAPVLFKRSAVTFKKIYSEFPWLSFAMLLVVAVAGLAGDSDSPAITFVHATDPHLFVKNKDATGAKQEDLNQKAITAMLQRLQGFSGASHAPAFLVLTGDLGVDPCDIPKTAWAADKKPTSKECVDSVDDSSKRADQIQKTSQALGSSPLKQIYLVAGNNDVANEDPDDVSLGYFNQFIDDLQKKIDQGKTGVQLHNLTACYATTGGASSCYADIPNSSYRLIGFPSYSFKNEGGKSTNNDAQAKQVETFRSLLEQARQAGKQVLILTHIPDTDDPFTIAQDRYTAKAPAPNNDKDPKNPRSPWSAWNVTTSILTVWKEALESDTVVAVLAGHLHDSHKEIYRPPYSWSSLGDARVGFRKLFLAPPLAVKNQDNTPIQARGFSLVTLAPHHIETLLYWYNSETREFTPDPPAEHAHRNRSWWRSPFFLSWMWGLDQSDSLLIRLAILLIALLTAYLTVVAIWNIPPAENPLAAKPADKSAGATSSASPFATDFGKTVIAGLSGLAVVEVAKSLGGDQASPGSRWFYIVWFVFFFFVMLFGLSLVRALAEGLRAVVAIPRYALSRPASPHVRGASTRALSWLGYWFLRIVHWIFSLKVPFLTVFDTFINLVQGRNQTMTRVFADELVEQQRNVVRVTDSIRKDLTKRIEKELGPTALDGPAPVRINISVLSADGSNVFYISRSTGSARHSFPKRSVAWVSVFTGTIRWFKKSFRELPDHSFDRIVLFDNQGGVIADAEKKILLASYYQDRADDYEAFVIFPVPWPHRGAGSDYVKGAIHISFRRQPDFETIWSAPELKPPEGGSPNELVYTQANVMLEVEGCQKPEVRVALTNSISILGEMLRRFNEVIFKNYIEPNQSD